MVYYEKIKKIIVQSSQSLSSLKLLLVSLSKSKTLFTLLSIIILSGALVSAGVYFIVTVDNDDNDITAQTILDTGKTVIGQDIVYPSGSPQITSKIVTIPVGAETGPHTHEYPMFGYVMEGEITVDYGGEGIKKFIKGDSLIEAINYTHNGKNTGDKPAKILVVVMGEN